MPRLNKIELPRVSITTDLEALEFHVKIAPMSPEAVIETLIYLQRERDKTEALNGPIAALRERLTAYYAALPAGNRASIRASNVGLVTYTPAGKRSVPLDRDKLVEALTPEQIRISYVPDMKALETILKPEVYRALTKEEPTKEKVTLRDSNGSDFEELDGF